MIYNDANPKSFKKLDESKISERKFFSDLSEESISEIKKRGEKYKRNRIFKGILKGKNIKTALKASVDNNAYYKIMDSDSLTNYKNRVCNSQSDRDLRKRKIIENDHVKYMQTLLNKDSEHSSVSSLKKTGFTPYFSRSSTANRIENFLSQSKSFRSKVSKDICVEKEKINSLKQININIIKGSYLTNKDNRSNSVDKKANIKQDIKGEIKNKKENIKDIYKDKGNISIKKKLNDAKESFAKEYKKVDTICSTIKEKGLEKLNKEIENKKEEKIELEKRIEQYNMKINYWNMRKIKYGIKTSLLSHNFNKISNIKNKLEEKNHEFDIVQLDSEVNQNKITLKQQLNENKSLKTEMNNLESIIKDNKCEIVKLRKFINQVVVS
jgi:hypothetical protein